MANCTSEHFFTREEQDCFDFYYASSAPEMTEEDITVLFMSDILDDKGNVIYNFGGQKRERCH